MMPSPRIRRSRSQQPALRHLAFFDAIAGLPPYAPERCPLTATLLTLRLADEWQRSGPPALDPACTALAATRRAIAECEAEAPLQQALHELVDAMCALPAPDAHALALRLESLRRVWDGRLAPELDEALRA